MSDVSGGFSYIGTDGQVHTGSGNAGLPAGLMYDAPSHTISGAWSGGAATDRAMRSAATGVKRIGSDPLPTMDIKRPDTIPIRPPRVATTQNIVKNANGTGTNPLNFFGGYSVVLDASPSQGGTVNGEYNSDSSLTATASSNAGYRFVSWTNEDGSLASKHSTFTFTPISNRALTAHFFSVPPNPTPRPRSTPKPPPTPGPTSTPRPSSTPK